MHFNDTNFNIFYYRTLPSGSLVHLHLTELYVVRISLQGNFPPCVPVARAHRQNSVFSRQCQKTFVRPGPANYFLLVFTQNRYSSAESFQMLSFS